MWTRLDDTLLDHRKMLEAARLLGKDGRARALGYYTAGLLYSSKHLTDGKLSPAIVDSLDIPVAGVSALVRVGLWQRTRQGWTINDFLDYNPPAAVVRLRRKKDAERKRRNGGRDYEKHR